jgi:transcriptional regulator with XRE-family HTH domain
MEPRAEHPAPPSFGELLRRYREAAELTQEALAERAELSARGLRYLEQGVRRPYQQTVRRLAESLALAPEERRALEAAARGQNPAAPLPALPSPHGRRGPSASSRLPAPCATRWASRSWPTGGSTTLATA